VEWSEGESIIRRAQALQVQMYEVAKGADPTTHILICGDDNRNAANVEVERVVCGRVGRVRERLLPQLDVRFRGVKFDASEEVDPCSMNPRFGDEAARLERCHFVVQMIGGEVEDL
jgi:hypothetical protein